MYQSPFCPFLPINYFLNSNVPNTELGGCSLHGGGRGGFIFLLANRRAQGALLLFLSNYRGTWKNFFLQFFSPPNCMTLRITLIGLFFNEDFWKIIFLYGEIFEFLLFFFCLKILFNVNGKATV